MIDNKIFVFLCILTALVLLIIVGILALSFLAYLDVAFGFSFIDGESLLRVINAQ